MVLIVRQWCVLLLVVGCVMMTLVCDVVFVGGGGVDYIIFWWLWWLWFCLMLLFLRFFKSFYWCLHCGCGDRAWFLFVCLCADDSFCTVVLTTLWWWCLRCGLLRHGVVVVSFVMVWWCRDSVLVSWQDLNLGLHDLEMTSLACKCVCPPVKSSSHYPLYTGQCHTNNTTQ